MDNLRECMLWYAVIKYGNLTFTCTTVNSGGSDELWFSLFYWCSISSVYQDVYKLQEHTTLIWPQ